MQLPTVPPEPKSPLARTIHATVGFVMSSIGKSIGTAIGGVLLAGFIGWAYGSFSVLAGAAALLGIGALVGRFILVPADQWALAYYNYTEFDKKREAWPPSRALLFRGEGEIWPSGRVIIRVFVTNVGHVEWLLTDATIPPNSFVIAYGIGATSPLVWVPQSGEVAIDQGQSAWLVFEGHVNIPNATVLDINQGHYGVIGQVGNATVRVCSKDDRTPITVPILNSSITGQHPLTIFIRAHQ